MSRIMTCLIDDMEEKSKCMSNSYLTYLTFYNDS
jgi:hypothetical protein